MLVIKDEVLDQIMCEYSRFSRIFHNKRKWVQMTEYELWQELCLCILSSNVPYELAQSAFFHLKKKGYLVLDWIIETPSSQELMAKELARPLYSPRKLDGSGRKYRFPNMRAQNIFQAAKILSSEQGWLFEVLANHGSEREVRDLLVVSISGLGLKEASHFLRNIGYSNELAIIDSHVVSFLKKIEAIPEMNTKTITRNTYFELEDLLKKICDKYGLSLSIFDMAIWHYMRRR